MPSTTKRPDRRLVWLGGGTGLALMLAAALLLRPGPSERPAIVQSPPPAPMAAEPPPSPTPAPPSAEGLRLYGLLGLGAIIGLPSGEQHLVRVGRDVIPGLRVARIEQQSVVLASSGGEVRLGFDGARPIGAPAAAAPPVVPANEQAWRDDTLTYRLGLAPRQVGSRVSGYVIRPGVQLPRLEQAGLQPGDLILRVNGSEFGEEALQELAWTMANSTHTDFEIERGGRRMQLSMPAHTG